jgi:hypothetical protein
MISSVRAVGSRLRGKTIFLSASVPVPKRAERYQRVEDAHFEIEQAVISLARAVFSESGQLVFGGHPAISPLVAMVAGEYRQPRYAESHEEKPAAPIRIFQSRAFEGFLPNDTLLMYQLGYATITWIDAANNERFDPTIEHEQSPCPESLRAMREAMIGWTSPAAMVCIGGMEGVEREAELFRELRSEAPVYVLERTGGASLILAHRRKDIRVIDSEIINRIVRLKADLPKPTFDSLASQIDQRPIVPYPLIMQTIVDEVSSQGGHGTGMRNG